VEIRGGDPTFTLVLVDGVPLNDGTSNQGDIASLAALSADEIEHIEIVRGPISSLYGSRALAGVVYLTTRRATGRGLSARARLAVGSAAQRQANGSLGAAGTKRDGQLGVSWEKEAGRVGDDRFESLGARLNAGLPLAGRPLRVRAHLGHWTGRTTPIPRAARCWATARCATRTAATGHSRATGRSLSAPIDGRVWKWPAFAAASSAPVRRWRRRSRLQRSHHARAMAPGLERELRSHARAATVEWCGRRA